MPFQITVEKPHQQKLIRNGDKGRDINDDLKTSLLLIPINLREKRIQKRNKKRLGAIIFILIDCISTCGNGLKCVLT